MGECPDAGCQKKLNGHHTTLYGPDGMGGVVGEQGKLKTCLNKMIPKSWLWKLVVSILIPFVCIFVYMWSDVKSMPDKFVEKKELASVHKRITLSKDVLDLKDTELGQRITILELQFTHIQKKLDAIENHNEKIRDTQNQILRRLPK